jgi:hypothetical protein
METFRPLISVRTTLNTVIIVIVIVVVVVVVITTTTTTTTIINIIGKTTLFEP